MPPGGTGARSARRRVFQSFRLLMPSEFFGREALGTKLTRTVKVFSQCLLLIRVRICKLLTDGNSSCFILIIIVN